MESESALRLRLAARVLVEWRIAASEGPYRDVVSELLQIHPEAKTWGLAPESPLFEIDDSNSVLWFLSETLRSTTRGPKLVNVEDLIFSSGLFKDERMNLLRSQIADRLIEFATGEKASTPLWKNGPSAAALSGRIFGAMNERFSFDVKALHAVLAIMLPETEPTRTKILDKFWLSTQGVSILASDIKVVETKRRSPRWKDAAFSVMLTGFLSLVMLFIAVSISKARGISLKISTRSLWFGALILILLFIVKTFPVHPQRVLLSALMLKGAINKLLKRFSMTHEKKLEINRDDLVAHHRLYFLLVSLIGEISHTEFDLFKALLVSESNCCPFLKHVLLGTAEWIYVKDAKVMLSDIRKSEIGAQTKAYLFQWLCKAKFIEYWQPSL